MLNSFSPIDRQIEDLGIIDTKRIISYIYTSYNVDFSNYSMTSLKRRFVYVLQKQKIRSVDEFVQRLEKKEFFEKVLFDVTVCSTEFFRDPSFWREFVHQVVAKMDTQVPYKIWLPDCSSGEELYSLAIILKEENLQDKVKIYASNISGEKIEFIKQGVYEEKREDVNSANYKRTNLKFAFEDYIKPQVGKFQIDVSLIANVEFLLTTSFTQNIPQGIKLVLFRNTLIYFNRTLQNDVVDAIYNTLLPGGILAIGNKETLNILESERKFRVLNETERIYQKILK